VNVLATPGMAFAEIVRAGGQRVSVGGGLAWIAVAAMMDAAKRLAEGDMSVLSADPPPSAWFLSERGA
jgi:septal ring-binding cell division protein DamX